MGLGTRWMSMGAAWLMLRCGRCSWLKRHALSQSLALALRLLPPTSSHTCSHKKLLSAHLIVASLQRSSTADKWRRASHIQLAFPVSTTPLHSFVSLSHPPFELLIVFSAPIVALFLFASLVQNEQVSNRHFQHSKDKLTWQLTSWWPMSARPMMTQPSF